MSKNGLLLTSLVAAIPGAVMACLMVMAFVNYAGGPTWWVKILAGMLLLIGTLLAAMPVGIFLFAGPKTEKPTQKDKDQAAEKSESGEVEAEAAGGDSAIAGAAEESSEGTDEAAVTREVTAAEDFGGEDFDLGPGSEFELEASEAEVESEDEPPRKGKK